ncbi:MAG: cytochrome c oxidase subunit II [Gemmatimonadetes bacterium]|nr:cytochrome c oxidase subunit II [Gemmatimonadota bacterium]
MPKLHLRRVFPVAVLALALVALAACGGDYPNSTFSKNTELNEGAVFLWDRMMLLGTIVFIVVETLLVYTIFKFRRREGGPAPRQIQGNAALEITWTAIPALILVFITVPTVRTIFENQRKAPAESLQVEVIGHQWWWEFRYPQYGIVTANELYLPVGKTVNFSLRTKDVLHSFWIPQLGGKRDLIANKVNHIWFTPKPEMDETALNGACVEYCGASHANMRFRTFTVTPADFEKWAAHQKTVALGSPAAAAAMAAADSAAKQPPIKTASLIPASSPAPHSASSSSPEVWVFPAEKMSDFNWPKTPLPATQFDESLLAAGDAAAGRALLTNPANLGKAPCLTCHVIKGETNYASDDNAKGPNLTHVGSRHTFAAGLYRLDAKTLALWIKNAPAMKPGSQMPTFGAGEYNPAIKAAVPAAAGLDDKQIADIVAYLRSLK